MTAHRPARGRPPLADVDDLRTRATPVILRLGYADASMARIAEELGVSVRTLHRYFPTKADIVWGGIDGSAQALHEAFAHVPADLTLIDALVAAITDLFASEAGGYELARSRLVLIASTPELRAARPGTYLQWRAELALFIAAWKGVPVDAIEPRTLAAGVHAAMDEALSWWAEHSDAPTPIEAVVESLRVFAGLADGR